eukprot:5622974-Amphidinium_carterae.1
MEEATSQPFKGKGYFLTLRNDGSPRSGLWSDCWDQRCPPHPVSIVQLQLGFGKLHIVRRFALARVESWQQQWVRCGMQAPSGSGIGLTSSSYFSAFLTLS